MSSQGFSFWNWFLHGTGGKSGLRRLIDPWVLVHFSVGLCLAVMTSIALEDNSKTILLPLLGILIGLCFAWGGNAQALVQTSEMEEVAENHEGGLADYVFTYQLSIFVILIALGVWGIAGFGIFDRLWPTQQGLYAYVAVKIMLFSVLSMAIREGWQVVIGAQQMVLARYQVKQTTKQSQKKSR